jgi:hypothetical protein
MYEGQYNELVVSASISQMILLLRESRENVTSLLVLLCLPRSYDYLPWHARSLVGSQGEITFDKCVLLMFIIDSVSVASDRMRYKAIIYDSENDIHSWGLISPLRIVSRRYFLGLYYADICY